VQTPQLVLRGCFSERTLTATLSSNLALAGCWCALLNAKRTTPTAASTLRGNYILLQTPQLVLCGCFSERTPTANLSSNLALAGRWCALLNAIRNSPTAAMMK